MSNTFSGRLTFAKLIYIWMRLMIYPTDSKFKNLRDKYVNKRCFIVALGPSLLLEDLDRLQENKEICFSVNAIYKLFSKTKWRPNFYFISDKNAYLGEAANDIEKILDNGVENVIYNEFYVPIRNNDAIPYKTNNINKILLSSKNPIFRKMASGCKFSKNPNKYVYDGSSSIHSVIQIAHYLGFNEVFLLGADCGSSTTLDHCESLGETGSGLYLNGEGSAMIKDYQSMLEDMRRKNISMKIYNATRGGYLDVFERVDLNQVLNNEKNKSKNF